MPSEDIEPRLFDMSVQALAPTQGMFDIESFATDSSISVVISFAAVKFRMYGPRPEIDDNHVVTQLDIREQVMNRRLITDSTIDFWHKQPSELRRDAISGNPSSPEAALRDLRGFFSDPFMPVWANGSVFDIGNIESLFRETSLLPPWQYNSPRDARTIYKVNPKRRSMPVELAQGFKEHLHDPVVDCHSQIWKLWEHWPFS